MASSWVPCASSPTPLPFEHPNLDMIPGHQMTSVEAFMDLLGGAGCEQELGRAWLEGEKKFLLTRNFTKLA